MLAWSRDLISCTGWSQRILISHSVLLLRSNNPFSPLLSFFPLLFPRKKIRNERQQEFEGNRSIDTAIKLDVKFVRVRIYIFPRALKMYKIFFQETAILFYFRWIITIFLLLSSPLLSVNIRCGHVETISTINRTILSLSFLSARLKSLFQRWFEFVHAIHRRVRLDLSVAIAIVSRGIILVRFRGSIYLTFLVQRYCCWKKHRV